MNNSAKTFFGLSFLLCILTLVSCKEYLDKNPQSNVSAKQAFKNFKNFQGFTEEIYQCMPNFIMTAYTNSWNWGDDEIGDTNYNGTVTAFDNGNFYSWQTEYGGSWMNRPNTSPGGGIRNHDLWNLGWYGIRKANMGLEHIDEFEGTQEQKDLLKGQLLFFRGWFHFQFMQFFGGLPYINHVLDSNNPDDLALKRLDYQDLADSVAQDFQKAADLLPINWDDTAPGKNTLGHNALRINKIVALGYLGKDLLWAGSPLMQQESQGEQEYTKAHTYEYNQEFCKRAAQAFGKLLSLTESGQADYELVSLDNFQDLFFSRGENWQLPGRKEAIFNGAYYNPWQTYFAPMNQYQPSFLQNGGNLMPVANYVDYFGMANGLPIKDITKAGPESGYDPTHPWQNRDPRFYKTFIYDGEQVVTAAGNLPDPNNQYANLYSGGSYRDGNTGSRTGYLMYKFIPKCANKYDNCIGFGNNPIMHIPWMRLGDVYLMYAEAAAEGYGSPTGKAPNYSKNALEAVNVIRDRANVDHIAPKYEGTLNGQVGVHDSFIDELRRERAVELAYEKHRFTDLRRWLLLTSRPYTYKKSVQFDRVGTFDPDNPRQNKVANLHEDVILEHHYIQKHYWLPLKRANVKINLKFKQNPGW